jgi:hypothetical protein
MRHRTERDFRRDIMRKEEEKNLLAAIVRLARLA